MKRVTFIFLTILSLYSCREYVIGQYPVDSVSPSPIYNPTVTNLPGKAVISYSLPKDTDLLYVKAYYTKTDGTESSVIASSFNNSIELKGFGRSKKQQVRLVAVDRSKNESSPVTIEIEPEDADVYTVMESLSVSETWGGIRLTWDNPNAEPVFLYVNIADPDGTVTTDVIYSESPVGESFVRGLENIPYDFTVTARDTYNNYTTAFETRATPWFEMQVPLKDCKVMPLGTGYSLSKWSNGDLFDNVWDANKPYYIQAGKANPYFTIYLGGEYQLSRVIWWPRGQYYYQLHDPYHFQFWGTADPAAAADPDNWEGWTLILDEYFHKPSGDDTPVISTDLEYAKAGLEYSIPDEAVSLSYFRLRCLSTWSNSTGCTCEEIHFFGRPIE